MTDQHPTITPPQWRIDEWQARIETMGADVPSILSEVAEWGYDHRGEVNEAKLQKARDEELEACCALIDDWGLDGNDLMECRRPKPPSDKEQALAALEDANLDAVHYNAILRALEGSNG